MDKVNRNNTTDCYLRNLKLLKELTPKIHKNSCKTKKIVSTNRKKDKKYK